MICAVHALIGAALGKSLKSRKQALLAGAISHFFADLLPHRDLSVKTEAALALTALAAIGAAEGWNSTAFWGAVGGVAPDLENAFSQTFHRTRNFFPSHTGLHGARVKEFTPQLVIALICWAVLLGRGAAPQAPTVEVESLAEARC